MQTAESNPERILMVCLGNICRSPLAEGIFRHRAALKGYPCEVDSAGTGAWHIGNPPHPMSQRVARENGIDISRLRARRFRPEDMIEFDHVFFMDRENLQDARQMAGSLWQPRKASLLLDALHPGQEREVPDPYFGDEADYYRVFDMIEAACDRIIEQWLRQA